MNYQRISLQELWKYLDGDRDKNRFVARVIFVDNFNTYYSLVDSLSERADITIRLSDERFCKGDVVPDIRALIAFLDENKDKDILIPHLAEYLRIGESVERNLGGLYSILNRHVHSQKRVWIPIFLAKGLFQRLVGSLDEERFGQTLIEIDEEPTNFESTVYASVFAKQAGLVDAVGIRAWLELWDDRKIKTMMTFATRHAKNIVPTDGDYTVKVITDPYDFLQNKLLDANPKLTKALGRDEDWAALIPLVHSTCTMQEILPKALNMLEFDPETLICDWDKLNEFRKWVFCLWYKLGLNQTSDYISFAVNQSVQYRGLIQSVECSIFDCIDSANFERWNDQRHNILSQMKNYSPSKDFFDKLDKIADNRVKFKILTGKTRAERIKILELVSSALKEGKTIKELGITLQEKYPDLSLYFKTSSYGSEDVREYIARYKYNKIADVFSLQLSENAGQIDCLQFPTRGSYLLKLKNTIPSAYFLWFDGLGIEWIDMLLAKIKEIRPTASILETCVVTAVLPTITAVNMNKADSDTISEKKIDILDNLSHIKDKSETNYFSIVAQQFEVIGSIAQMIIDTIDAHPDREVIVTADHGMSRMAAKGFHETQGVCLPSNSEPCNHGRYCILSSKTDSVNISNTKREGNIVAFRTHNHFTFSGYAPGEIHGGATPEEMLVPIIHFAKPKLGTAHRKNIGYKLISQEVFLDGVGNVTVIIKTSEAADSLTVDINGKIINGITLDHVTWSVKIDGLSAGNSYSMYVYPNNLTTQQSEMIYVKRRGVVVDDDL